MVVVLLCGLMLALLPGGDARRFRGFRVRTSKVRTVPKVSVPKVSVPDVSFPDNSKWHETISGTRFKDGEKLINFFLRIFELNEHYVVFTA